MRREGLQIQSNLPRQGGEKTGSLKSSCTCRLFCKPQLLVSFWNSHCII